MTEKRLVTLVGGHFDGEVVGVEPTRRRFALTWERGEGEWQFDDRVYPTQLVCLDVYERVDAETFEVAA